MTTVHTIYFGEQGHYELELAYMGFLWMNNEPQTLRSRLAYFLRMAR